MDGAPKVDGRKVKTFAQLCAYITSDKRGMYQLAAEVLEQKGEIVGIEIEDRPRYVGDGALARAIQDVNALWQAMFEREYQVEMA